MTMPEEKSKDGWDKAEVMAKVFSGLILGALTLVIGYGSNRIATSLETGQLVQSLITDLAVPDTTIRQDIALIALNHSVGDQNPRLVLDICERVLRNTDDFDSLAGNVAFAIIRGRDPARASRIEEEARALARRVQAQHFADTLAAEDDTSSVTREQVSRKQAYQAAQQQFIARVLPNRVYIQFNAEEGRELVERLQLYLQDAGLNAPGVERVKGDYANGVRYFHEQDRALAERVAALTTAFFEKQGHPLRVPPVDYTGAAVEGAAGQVEVWLNPRAEASRRGRSG